MLRSLALFLLGSGIFLFNLPGYGEANAQEAAQLPQPPESKYAKALFQGPIPSDQLTFLKPFAGTAANELFRDT